MSTLKPCPFCGGTVNLELDREDADGWADPPLIWCPTCSRDFDFPETDGYSLDEFLAWWNTRPAETWQPMENMDIYLDRSRIKIGEDGSYMIAFGEDTDGISQDALVYLPDDLRLCRRKPT